jgi:integrase/recombinase XerC
MDFDGFTSYMECNKGCTPRTTKSYRSDLELFHAFLREKSVMRLSQADHAVIKDYIEHMRRKPNPRFGKIGLADSSIARRLAAVSSYFDYIRATADSKFRNPIVELSNRWQMNKDPKPVDEMTLDLIISGITDLRDRTLFTLFLSTGLRISEMAQLNRDSIEMVEETDEDGTTRLIGHGTVIGKGRKPRTFYVDRETLRLLSKFLLSRQDDLAPLFLSQRRQRMSVRAIQERLGYWCRRLNAPHINVHRLRHTFATRLINGNISSMILKDLLGHKSLA